MKIKKIALLSLALCALNVLAAPVTYTKAGMGDDGRFGTTKMESYDVAISLNDPGLRGSQISGLRAPLTTTEHISGVKAFITKTLATEKVNNVRVNKADIEEVEARIEDGCIVADFASGYVLDGSTVYVGYSFNIDELSDANRYPVAGKIVKTDGGFYLRTSRSYQLWKDMNDEQTFTSSMTVYLEGEFSAVGASISMNTLTFVEHHKDFTIPVTLTNQGSEPIKSFNYSWKIEDFKGDGFYELDEPMDVEFGRKYVFNFPIDGKNIDKGYKDIEISLDKINGIDNNTPGRVASRQVRFVSRIPVRRPLVEEYTGTWCGNCTRGIASLEYMRKKYGTDFIGVAYHTNSSQPDPMFVSDLVKPNSVQGVPTCYIDRWDQMDPYHGKLEEGQTVLTQTFAFDKFWLATRAEFTPVAINVKSYWSEDDKDIIVDTEVVWVDEPENSNYGLGFVLCEDGVRNRDANPNANPWVQTNYMVGATSYIPEVEQFARGGMYMMNLTYNDVALKSTGKDPLTGCFPKNIVADEVYNNTYTFKNVNSIIGYTGVELMQDRNNMRVVALVTDRETMRVVNAAVCRVGGPSSDEEAVNNNYGDDDPNQGNGVDEITSNEVSSVNYYDVNGIRVENPANGLYIRVVNYNDGRVETDKVIIK